ncbi:DUF4272 domain-containing protein [Tundrisphaera sp. TA3]|uniref:DUF4272 domain-containing protein n=1 Tax=Tundrisphaera sp. TA3 TaxID=3435775 RepID=UPI003EBEC9C4
MGTTEQWAMAHGISVAETPPAIPDFSEPWPHPARHVAERAVILQGIVAVGYGVEPGPVTAWLQEQGIWERVSPGEMAFLLDPSPTDEERNRFRWHQEAERTLLWAIGKVEALGLPTRGCDTRRLVDEIIPPLGSEVEGFLASAELRSPGVLLAEDDRTYELWCRAVAARREGEPLPQDLNWLVLYERRYAFEWLGGPREWDEITCDA